MQHVKDSAAKSGAGAGAAAGGGGAGAPGAGSQSAAGAASAAAEAADRLHERGDKLASLAEKTGRMELQAQSFAQAAKQLRQKEQAKSGFLGL